MLMVDGMLTLSESISGRYSLHHIFDNPDAGTDQIGIYVLKTCIRQRELQDGHFLSGMAMIPHPQITGQSS